MVIEKLNYIVECTTQDLIRYLIEDNENSNLKEELNP